MQKITSFLWFNNNAEEAVQFYQSVFSDQKTGIAAHYGADGPGPQGQVMVVPFELFGQQFIALNGGPKFKFTEAISFVVNCEGQEEVDYYWERLSEGGEKGRCGWLKDRFGLSWQVVPTILSKLMQDTDKEKSGRVMQAMLQMDKIDIQTLQQA